MPLKTQEKKMKLRSFKSMACRVCYRSGLFVLCILVSISQSFSQQIIDRVVGVVGKEIILQSDIENQYIQLLQQGVGNDPDVKCSIMQQLLLQKLFIHQADVDSVIVSDNQVETELDRRIRYFVNQLGSEEKLEEYYKKGVAQIKEDFRELIRDQLTAQTMQSKVTGDLSTGPADVQNYFLSIHPDSVPLISSELEVAQIVRFPVIAEEDKNDIKNKLMDLRNKISAGSDFAVMAGLYSQDPGSARKGGELGFVNRGDLDPAFAQVAFSLKNKEISPVFESSFGFHIVQLLERRGSQVNVRHILMKPQFKPEQLTLAGDFLDSLRTVIQSGAITFSEAAQANSDDSETKNNGGLLINPETGNSRFEPSQLDPSVFFLIDKMNTGEISTPQIFYTRDLKQGYRLLYLKTRTRPHRANLTEDYQKIQAAAMEEKQAEAVRIWVERKRKITHIKIVPDLLDCPGVAEWLPKP